MILSFWFSIILALYPQTARPLRPIDLRGGQRTTVRIEAPRPVDRVCRVVRGAVICNGEQPAPER